MTKETIAEIGHFLDCPMAKNWKRKIEKTNMECAKCGRTSSVVNLNENCPFCTPTQPQWEIEVSDKIRFWLDDFSLSDWIEERGHCGTKKVIADFVIGTFKSFISSLLLSEKEKVEVELAEKYAHKTEEGWCCACPYDIMQLNKRIDEEKSRLLQQIKDIVPKERERFVYEMTESEKIYTFGWNDCREQMLSELKKII